MNSEVSRIAGAFKIRLVRVYDIHSVGKPTASSITLVVLLLPTDYLDIQALHGTV